MASTQEKGLVFLKLVHVCVKHRNQTWKYRFHVKWHVLLFEGKHRLPKHMKMVEIIIKVNGYTQVSVRNVVVKHSNPFKRLHIIWPETLDINVSTIVSNNTRNLNLNLNLNLKFKRQSPIRIIKAQKKIECKITKFKFFFQKNYLELHIYLWDNEQAMGNLLHLCLWKLLDHELVGRRKTHPQLGYYIPQITAEVAPVEKKANIAFLIFRFLL